MACPEMQHLQQKLAITPKTASLLFRLGYREFRELKDSTPEQIVAQLCSLPDVKPAQAETYRRGLRRMVWLATQDDPESKAKIYSDWTQKALKARGVWVEDFDSMTGDQSDRHITLQGEKP